VSAAGLRVGQLPILWAVAWNSIRVGSEKRKKGGAKKGGGIRDRSVPALKQFRVKKRVVTPKEPQKSERKQKNIRGKKLQNPSCRGHLEKQKRKGRTEEIRLRGDI